jgi:photosystem II stability/assembly factor-like uncharacterized protein
MKELFSLIIIILSLYSTISAQTFWEKCGKYPTPTNSTLTLNGFVMGADNVMMGYRKAVQNSGNWGTLFISKDLGKTWKDITNSLPDLVANPNNDAYLRATNVLKNRIHSVAAIENSLVVIHGAGGDIRFIRSSDQGKSWEQLPKGNTIHERMALSAEADLCPNARSNKLTAASTYATMKGKNYAIFKSSDKGKTWQQDILEEGRINEKGRFNRMSDETTWFHSENWGNRQPTHPQKRFNSDIINIKGNGDVLYGLAAKKEMGMFGPTMIARNLYSELVKSTDNGKSWQIVTTDGKKIQDIKFVDCKGNIYAHLTQSQPQQKKKLGDVFSQLSKPRKTIKTPPVHLFRLRSGATNWEELSGLPDNGAAHNYLVSNDGRLYTVVNGLIFRSREVVCCDTEEEEEPPCELTMDDFPSLSPITKTLPANTKGKLSTGVQVKKGDYVCVVAKGKAAIKYNTKVQQVVYENELEISPVGHTDPERLQRLNDFKKYPEHYLGQVIISLGERNYSCNEFTLKEDDCDYIPDEFLLQKFTFINLYGDYFIAQKDGILDLEINHLNSGKNNGQFEIEIYLLTAKQHKYRNCFNKCPKKRPSLINKGISYKDRNDYLWDDYTTFPNVDVLSPIYALDAIIEKCYHPNSDEFRGQSPIVKGCQCAYDDATKEFVNDAHDPSLRLGTFDYGYINIKEDNLRLHFIFDIFPHVIYAQDKSFRYTATPKSNIY